MTFICYSTLDPWNLVLKLRSENITPGTPDHFEIQKKHSLLSGNVPILCFSSIVRFIRPAQTRNYQPTATLQNCVPSPRFGFEVLVLQQYRKLNFYSLGKNLYPFALVKSSLANRSVQIPPASPNYSHLHPQQSPAPAELGGQECTTAVRKLSWWELRSNLAERSPTGCNHRTARVPVSLTDGELTASANEKGGLGEDASSATRYPAS